MKLPENMYPKKTDTPRTDAAHDPTSPEILYFEAKKMEKELTAAQEHAERLRVALVRVLASAHPSAKDNPAMYAAWALAKEALAAPSGQRSPWLPIESAPRDGTMFIGRKGDYVAPTKLGKYYEKWPHEEGGPTYREEWNNCQFDSVSPWNPTHWMPLSALSEKEAE